MHSQTWASSSALYRFGRLSKMYTTFRLSLVFAPHSVNASTCRVRVTDKVGIKVRIRVRFNVRVMVNDSINVMWCINLGDPYSCKFSVSCTSSR